MSFVNLNDSFINADAKKTINMIIYYANKLGFMVPTIYTNEYKKYSKHKY